MKKRIEAELQYRQACMHTHTHAHAQKVRER